MKPELFIPEQTNKSRLPSPELRKQRARRRKLFDLGWYGLITLAGVSVILALLAIFLYLLSEVMPLFKPLQVELIAAPLATPSEPVAGMMNSRHEASLLAQKLANKSDFQYDFSLLDGSGRYLVLAKRNGEACFINSELFAAGCSQRLSLTDRTVELTAILWLAGKQTLITGDSSGQIKQWFLLPDEQGLVRLTWVKPYQRRAGAIVAIAAEQRRGGFAVLDASGALSLFYATLTKPLWQKRFSELQPAALTIDELRFNQSNNQLLLLSNAQAVYQANIDNKHPEIHWRSLWQKIWYESWQQPEYVWQSSGSSDASLGKYSLVPLTVGTLKAAIYALLFAVPLAILAAIYSVCYLAEPVRSRLANMIEFMALFPTVIIGFLAAIWLAPMLEQQLLALLFFVLFTPVLLLFAARFARYLPAALQQTTGHSLMLLLMLLILCCSAVLAWLLGSVIEQWLFAGSLTVWLDGLGVHYQQRNALVVGLAMGFSVLPVVFSLSFDALSQIPKQLTQGAYALGANHWQIVQRIMLPVAAPGILAAVLLGLSRAIGETMIILMATGNNPITNFNLFEGLRSLTATLVIELPEAAVDSSHYRVLFLVAILLFIFTFTCNTLADLIRQRLRQKLQRLE